MSDTWLTEAAVRVHFHASELSQTPAPGELEDFATPLKDGRWMLPEGVRREELSRAGLDKVRAALAQVTPGAEEDPRQQQLRTLVSGSAAQLESWSSDELRNSLSVVKWLSDIPNIELPDPESILGKYERKELLRPLQDAVHFFRGRAKELDRLQRHALGQSPGTTILVSGVGGTGKTTLLCRHVLHLEKLKVPVAYLDLDRADLALTERRVEQGLESVTRGDHRPGMLAAEIILQLATIAGDPSYRRFAKSRRRDWLGGAPFAHDLQGMMAALKLARAVVVVDTLEEAQYAGASAISAIREMIRAISSVNPNVRFVIGGRADEPQLDAEPLVLGNLEPADATELLRSIAKPLELSQEDANEVVSRVTTNPLWLVVAGQAIARKAVDVRDIEGLHGAAATAFLYLRILGHVHDVPFPELIEPSLMLRVVHTGLLTDVIAPELGESLSLPQAELHIAALGREVALARPAGAGVRHRPEVRVLTLQGLYQADQGRWGRIHQRAAAWWRQQPDPESEGEWQYHEQMLRHGPGQTQTVEPQPRARTGRVTRGVMVSPTSIADAEQAAQTGDWAQVEQLLEHETSAKALMLRAQARYALHFPAQAMELMQRAWQTARAAKETVIAHDSVLSLADWLGEAGRTEEAAQTLDEALQGEEAPIRCVRLLDRRHTLDARPDDQAVLAAAFERLGGLDQLAKDQPLLRRLVGWVDDERLLLQALSSLGLAGWSTEAMQQLTSALADWEESSGLAALTSDAVIGAGDLLSLFQQVFHDSSELSGFVASYSPQLTGHFSTNLTLEELAFEYVQTLERFALTGEQLRRALLDFSPQLATTINAFWRRAGLRQRPDEMARSIAKLRDRQGALNADVAKALRAGFGATTQAGDSIGLRNLAELLGAALPTERQRQQVATTLRLPDPLVAARDPISLIRSAEAMGVFGDSGDTPGLISLVASLEPAFATSLRELERQRRLLTYARALGDIGEPDRALELSTPEPSVLEQVVADARPAILIRDDTFPAPGPVWAARLAEAAPRIVAAIRAVARVAYEDVSRPFIGTAVMVGTDLALTTRHVAELFADGVGRSAKLKPEPVTLELLSGAAKRTALDVTGVVLIHPYWDVALLRVAGFSGTPLALSTSASLSPGRVVTEIGHPVPSQVDDLRIAPDVFRDAGGAACLCPGRLLERRSVSSYGNPVSALAYDSSTIGARSGAALVDVETGELLGLHFAHRYLEGNYAVPSFELARDEVVIATGIKFASPPPGGPARWDRYWRV